MASTAHTDVSELEKKDVLAGDEADNPEEPMEEEDDDNEEAGDGDDGDVEEDVIVQIGATYSCKRQDGSYHDAEVVKTRMNKQAGREEFFVHYIGLNRRQNEWVEKTRLVIPKPVKEGQAANSAEPEVTEDGKASLKRKNEDGAPDAKKVKVDTENDSSVNSVMASEAFAEELTCLLCSELFKYPVMVECGHNFCRNCIDKAWDGQESFTCPDCKEVITDKRYTTNRALANLVKKTVGTSSSSLTPAKPKLAENCPEHDERLKLYCKDDGTLSCVICRDSLKHASHNFLPILDAVGVYRTELSAIVAPLEEAQKVTEQLTDEQKEKVEQHKSNVSESRLHIVSEFEKMRAFFKEQEEKLLENLKEQGDNLLKEMEANVMKMQENQDNIRQTITMANERADDTDSISFLTGIKSFIEKCQEQQKDVMVAGNTLLSKDLCHGTFKGPIQYAAWKLMKFSIVPCVQSASPQGTTSGDPVSSIPMGHSDESLTPLIRSSVTSATWQVHGIFRPAVYILGHSYVYRAAKRAELCPGGKNLGFQGLEINWRGFGGLQWQRVIPEIVKIAKVANGPVILVLHAGGNDLVVRKGNELRTLMTTDIERFKSLLPQMILVWSEIVSRDVWIGALDPTAIERSRRKVNAWMAKFVREQGGIVVRHHQLEGDNSALLNPDGIHLTDAGLDIFLSNLQFGVEQALTLMGEGLSPV
ncbi:nuclear factor 7, brain-like isoform X1 [Ranitomeya variabilis]|uniref:nuclear factor 7, brain-like isoform X1 n=2 Tax=Ranitomeya variabilis TaxID=490064 RepID=UPI0040561703